MKEPPTIVLPEHVHDEIQRVVSTTKGSDETGVSLFGAATREHRVALAVAGPGPEARRTPVSYQPDVEYANAVFDALTSALPGIRWIAEFHVHPRGMTLLSRRDRETVRSLLAHAELNLDDFVAGILQRKNGEVRIYPYYFSREDQVGQTASLEVVPSDADVVRTAREAAMGAEVGVEPRLQGPQSKSPKSGAYPRWLQCVTQHLWRKR